MMPYGLHDGAWGYVMMIGSWAFLGLLVYLVARAVTSSERRDVSPRGGEAQQILDQRLARGHVPVNYGIGQFSKLHARDGDFRKNLIAPIRDGQRNTGQHFVPLATEQAQHSPRIFRIHRLTSNLAVHHNSRVRAELPFTA